MERALRRAPAAAAAVAPADLGGDAAGRPHRRDAGRRRAHRHRRPPGRDRRQPHRALASDRPADRGGSGLAPAARRHRRRAALQAGAPRGLLRHRRRAHDGRLLEPLRRPHPAPAPDDDAGAAEPLERHASHLGGCRKRRADASAAAGVEHRRRAVDLGRRRRRPGGFGQPGLSVTSRPTRCGSTRSPARRG